MLWKIIRGFRGYVFLSGFFFVMVFQSVFFKSPIGLFGKSLRTFWKNHMKFLKKPYGFLQKKPYWFFDCYGFSSSFFFVMVFHSSNKSKKTITKKKLDKKPITIKESIWFSLKNPYGFFLKIHMIFSWKFIRIFLKFIGVFTKSITKKKQIKNP